MSKQNLKAFLKLSTVIVSSLELNSILSAACRSAVELIGVDHSGLVIFDEAREKGDVRAEYPESLGARGLEIQLRGVQAEEQLLDSIQPIQFEHIENEPSLGSVRDVLVGLGIRSILIVPVVGKNGLLGSFSLDSIKQPRRFTEDEIDLCKLFASQVAVAIENAALFEEVTKQKSNLERLLVVSNLITDATDLEDGLQGFAKMVVSLISSTFCRVLLVDESGKDLVVKASYPITRQGEGLVWEPALNGRAAISDWPNLESLLRAGRPVVLKASNENVRSSLQLLSRQLQLKDDIQSLLMVPLTIGDRLVGLLDVGEVRSERNSFTKEKLDLTSTIASQTTALIDRLWRHHIDERRKKLLTVLDESLLHIRGEKETSKLYKEIVHLSVERFGFEMAAVYVNHPHLKDLELRDTFGHIDEAQAETLRRAETLVEQVTLDGHSRTSEFVLHGREARDESAKSFAKLMIGVPLKHVGSVEAVLIVVGKQRPEHIETDLDILKRFAAQASIALQTSKLMRREDRVFSQLMILQKIGGYTLRAQADGALDKILHVVMTGVTAGYGLGFNRAVLFLRDERDGDLVGRIGIGQISEKDAQNAWAFDNEKELYDFVEYINWLEREWLPPTPVGRMATEMRFRVKPTGSDAFSRAVLNREWILVTPERFNDLRQEFIKKFQPTTPVAVVPLVAREHVIGLLVADNKFTQSPINPHEDIAALLTFAQTAAMAIDNVRLFQQSQNAQEQMRSLYQASNTLVSSKEPRHVLQEVVQQTRQAAGALWARLILIDELGRARTLVTDGETTEVSPDEALRSGGIALQVMKSGRPEVIADKRTHHQSINPVLLRDNAVAALCLPLSLQGKHIGVMWIGYLDKRPFHDFDVSALQLFVNQAAIAYDNARRIGELDHMRQAAENLAEGADVEGVLARIVDAACFVLEAESAAIWSYDQVRNTFIQELSVAAGITVEDWLEYWKSEPKPHGTAYTVMEQKYVGVTDVSDADRYPFLGETTRRLLAETKIKSFQGISLTVGEENLGVLYVNYDRPRSFSEEERQTARTFANHAAVALKKARLLEQVTKARNASRVVAEATTLEDLEGTLASIVRGTRDALRSDAVTLYSYDWSRGECGFPPVMVGVDCEEDVLRLGRVAEESVVRKVLELDAIYVAENAPDDPLMRGRFVRVERVASTVAIPLKAGERKVGAMFVNYRNPHRFSQDELTNIELFAYQAAVAIRNTQLYRQSQKRVDALQSLFEAGKAITSTLDLDDILNRIAEQGWLLVSEQKRHASFIDIKLVDGAKATLGAAYPIEGFDNIRDVLGEEIDLENGIAGRPGIVGRAFKERRNQVVNDVENDSDYLQLRKETRSQLVVLIKKDEEIIGVISVEHPKRNAFDAEDEKTFDLLAAQASIAIQNAKAFNELKQTKTQLTAASALAYAGMDSGIRRHAIEGNAINIQNHLTLVRMDLTSWNLGEERLEQMEKRLRFINTQAQQIINKRLIPPLSPDVEVEPVFIDELIRERIAQLGNVSADSSLEYSLALDAENQKVRVSRDWFRRALDILVENARKAMQDTGNKLLSIATVTENNKVRIDISDSGKGIPDEIVGKLFREPIKKKSDETGMGIGLLMVQAIVQTYNGAVKMVRTGPSGTTFSIFLPIEG